MRFFDPEEIPRAVSAVSKKLVTDGFERPSHSHVSGAQLFLCVKGLIKCKADRGLWMVPPQCAVWVPAGMQHSVRVGGNLELYILFVATNVARGLPSECCTIVVSPLLRELIIATSRLPHLYDQDGAAGRLVKTMLDQLSVAPVEGLHLPLPSDPRLRRIADALTNNPSDRATIGEWARRIGMSERALFRLVRQETGMSFGRWRQQADIMFAVERLSEGDAVQNVAFNLGYDSTSAFISMFKKVLGQPPARYLAARRMKSEVS